MSTAVLSRSKVESIEDEFGDGMIATFLQGLYYPGNHALSCVRHGNDVLDDGSCTKADGCSHAGDGQIIALVNATSSAVEVRMSLARRTGEDDVSVLADDFPVASAPLVVPPFEPGAGSPEAGIQMETRRSWWAGGDGGSLTFPLSYQGRGDRGGKSEEAKPKPPPYRSPRIREPSQVR